MHTITPSSHVPRPQDSLRFMALIICSVFSLSAAILARNAIDNIASIRGSTYQALAVDGQLSRLASEVANQTLESRRYEKDFFLNIETPHVRALYLAKWHTSTAALDGAISAFAAAATTPQDQAQAALWRRQADQYVGDFGQVERMVSSGRITTSQDANAAFTPFKENIRVLTESSAGVASLKAQQVALTGAGLEAIGARAIWLVEALAALTLTVVVGYSLADTLAVRRSCRDCGARLPFRGWFGGAHRCHACDLRRSASLVDAASMSADIDWQDEGPGR